MHCVRIHPFHGLMFSCVNFSVFVYYMWVEEIESNRASARARERVGNPWTTERMAHKISKNTNITNTFSIVYSCSCRCCCGGCCCFCYSFHPFSFMVTLLLPSRFYVTYIFSVSAFNLLLGVFLFRFSVHFVTHTTNFRPPLFSPLFYQVPISLLFYCLIRLTCLKQITWIDGLGNVLTTGIDYMKEPLPDSRRITAKSILKLTPKKEHHNTTFTCQAQNTADRTYRSAKLHLEVSVCRTHLVCVQAERKREKGNVESD